MNFQQSKDTVISIKILVTLFYAIICVKTAWVCDDAFITLRTVDNFIHGHGLTWNPGERVQSFTHPLWLFILSSFYVFIRDAYFLTLVLSFILSMAAFGIIIWKFANGATQTLFCALALCCSRAFIDYSSSGLENPLAHVLFALYILHTYDPEEKPLPVRTLRGAVVLSLIALTRLDLVLLAAPHFCWELYSSVKHNGASWKTVLIRAVIGLSPLIVWEIVFNRLLWVSFPEYRVCKTQYRAAFNADRAAGPVLFCQLAPMGFAHAAPDILGGRHEYVLQAAEGGPLYDGNPALFFMCG